MSSDESPQDKYERIQRQIQDTILSSYPNPERKGCPGPETLQRLARTSVAGEPNDDSNSEWRHVTHCSECYREYLAVRARVYGVKVRRVNAIRWGVAGSILLAALAFFLFVRVPGFIERQRPQNAELAYQPKTINIASMKRSANGTDSDANAEILLNRGLVDLTVQLPIGSKAGTYQFRLRARDRSSTLMKSADASIREGVTSFEVKLDLREEAPGVYSMDIRQSPFDWSYTPVRLK